MLKEVIISPSLYVVLVVKVVKYKALVLASVISNLGFPQPTFIQFGVISSSILHLMELSKLSNFQGKSKPKVFQGIVFILWLRLSGK